jgi:hypothetical protein
MAMLTAKTRIPKKDMEEYAPLRSGDDRLAIAADAPEA